MSFAYSISGKTRIGGDESEESFLAFRLFWPAMWCLRRIPQEAPDHRVPGAWKKVFTIFIIKNICLEALLTDIHSQQADKQSRIYNRSFGSICSKYFDGLRRFLSMSRRQKEISNFLVSGLSTSLSQRYENNWKPKKIGNWLIHRCGRTLNFSATWSILIFQS